MRVFRFVILPSWLVSAHPTVAVRALAHGFDRNESCEHFNHVVVTEQMIGHRQVTFRDGANVDSDLHSWQALVHHAVEWL